MKKTIAAASTILALYGCKSPVEWTAPVNRDFNTSYSSISNYDSKVIQSSLNRLREWLPGQPAASNYSPEQRKLMYYQAEILRMEAQRMKEERLMQQFDAIGKNIRKSFDGSSYLLKGMENLESLNENLHIWKQNAPYIMKRWFQ